MSLWRTLCIRVNEVFLPLTLIGLLKLFSDARGQFWRIIAATSILAVLRCLVWLERWFGRQFSTFAYASFLAVALFQVGEIFLNPLPILVEEDGTQKKVFTQWRNIPKELIETLRPIPSTLSWERNSRLLRVLDTVRVSMSGDTLKTVISTHTLLNTRPDSFAVRVKIRHRNGTYAQRASFRIIKPFYGESIIYQAKDNIFLVPITTDADTLIFRVGTSEGQKNMEVRLWEPMAYLEFD